MRHAKRVAGALALAACTIPGLAVHAHTLTISATVLSKSNCRFITAASTLALAIDPASASPVSGSASVSFRCAGSASVAAWAISHNAGLHGSGPSALRMRHASVPAETMAYTLAYPASGTVAKNVTNTITVTASVAPADFQNALAGAYSDTVSLLLLP